MDYKKVYEEWLNIYFDEETKAGTSRYRQG